MNELTLDLDGMCKVANAIAKSKLFPQWDTPEKVLTLMTLAKSEGRDCLSAINRYDYINGRVAKRANAMLEDFIISGGKIKWIITNDKEAEAVFYPPGGEPLQHKITWQEIVRANLHNKDNYKKFPAQMLRARLISSALRMCFPMATGQLYSPEEAEVFIDDKPADATKKNTEIFREPKKQNVIETKVEYETVTNTDTNIVTNTETNTVTNTDTKTVTNIANIMDDIAADIIIESELAALDRNKLNGYLKSIKWIKEDVSELTEIQRKKIAERFNVFREKVNNYEGKE